jgi:hypothetical protein
MPFIPLLLSRTEGDVQIVFETAETGRTLIEIYDMNGRIVASVFNQQATKGLEYRVDFDGTSLPNGIYIYKMKTNTNTEIEKFMIAR